MSGAQEHNNPDNEHSVESARGRGQTPVAESFLVIGYRAVSATPCHYLWPDLWWYHTLLAKSLSQSDIFQITYHLVKLCPKELDIGLINVMPRWRQAKESVIWLGLLMLLGLYGANSLSRPQTHNHR